MTTPTNKEHLIKLFGQKKEENCGETMTSHARASVPELVATDLSRDSRTAWRNRPNTKVGKEVGGHSCCLEHLQGNKKTVADLKSILLTLKDGRWRLKSAAREKLIFATKEMSFCLYRVSQAIYIYC